MKFRRREDEKKLTFTFCSEVMNEPFVRSRDHFPDLKVPNFPGTSSDVVLKKMGTGFGPDPTFKIQSKIQLSARICLITSVT